MKLVILTSHVRGLAPRCIPQLCASSKLELRAVVLTQPWRGSLGQRLRRKAMKIARIGVLAALNGVRIRRWFRDDQTETVEEACIRHDVPLIRPGPLNSPETVEALRGIGADLALSLGNGYILTRVFSVPRYGMINVHTEQLPRFPGAQSVIWPIHEECDTTGFAIHQIDRHIDKGAILHQASFPIQFMSCLEETVRVNVARTRSMVPQAVADVCERYEALAANGISGSSEKAFTTPTLRQFMRMLSNHGRLRARAAGTLGH